MGEGQLYSTIDDLVSDASLAISPASFDGTRYSILSLDYEIGGHRADQPQHVKAT
jgi:hypothetical protein